MLCCTSCTEITRFARQHGVKMLGELLTVLSQFVAWWWNLDENLIFVKQVGFLCRLFPFFTFIQRFSSAPAKSGAANTSDCSRHFGKKNNTKDWLTQKDLCHVKVWVEEWNGMEDMKGGMKNGYLQSPVKSEICLSLRRGTKNSSNSNPMGFIEPLHPFEAALFLACGKVSHKTLNKLVTS